MAIKKSKKNFYICLSLYLLALAVRLFGIRDVFVYPDEVTWMVKGKEYIYALKSLNIEYFKHAWWNDTTETYAISLPLVLTNGLFHVFFAGTGKYSLHLFSDIVASRIPVVVLASFVPVILFLFASKFLHSRVGFMAAVAYLISPVSVQFDRWIINDAYLTLFTCAALYTYAKHDHDKNSSIWPGFFLALAFLTKPHGVLPIIAWAYWLVKTKNKNSLKLFFTSIATFLVTVTVLWPESWRRPIFSIFEYAYRQSRLSEIPIMDYYFGKTTPNPGWTYYLFKLMIRLPEIIIGLFIFGLVYLPKLFKTKYQLGIFIYSLVFWAVISFSSKFATIRYFLPIIPWIYLVSAYVFDQLIVGLFYPIRYFIYLIVLLLLLTPLAYGPNLDLYHNFLLGNPRYIQANDMVGLCHGNKTALNFLDQHFPYGSTTIIGCADSGPYHTSRQLTKDLYQAQFVILEYPFIQQYPNSPAVAYARSLHLKKTIIEHGFITAYVYQK